MQKKWAMKWKLAFHSLERVRTHGSGFMGFCLGFRGVSFHGSFGLPHKKRHETQVPVARGLLTGSVAESRNVLYRCYRNYVPLFPEGRTSKLRFECISPHCARLVLTYPPKRHTLVTLTPNRVDFVNGGIEGIVVIQREGVDDPHFKTKRMTPDDVAKGLWFGTKGCKARQALVDIWCCPNYHLLRAVFLV